MLSYFKQRGPFLELVDIWTKGNYVCLVAVALWRRDIYTRLVEQPHTYYRGGRLTLAKTFLGTFILREIWFWKPLTHKQLIWTTKSKVYSLGLLHRTASHSSPFVECAANLMADVSQDVSNEPLVAGRSLPRLTAFAICNE